MTEKKVDCEAKTYKPTFLELKSGIIKNGFRWIINVKRSDYVETNWGVKRKQKPFALSKGVIFGDYVSLDGRFADGWVGLWKKIKI